MQDNLVVSTLQSDIVWENPQKNREILAATISSLAGQTDLIILPEMFTTGFSMETEKLAETMQGPTVAWMAEQAQKTGAVVTGSLIIQERGDYFNRLIWMRPDGNFSTYDKRHLFTYAEEDKHFTAGDSHLLVEWRGWTICPLICYDLRFPVWSRNNHHYDLLIYVANFPAARKFHWKSLLVARAIENQVYTIGVNRVGKDGKDIAYHGDTMVINYAGETLQHLAKIPNVSTLELSFGQQQVYRTQYQFLQDADRFSFR